MSCERKQQSEPNALRVMMVMMASNRLSSQGKAMENGRYIAQPPRKAVGAEDTNAHKL